MLDGANMVEVSMGEEHSPDAVFTSPQAGHIGDEVIDPQHIFIRELKANVDNEDVLIHFDDEAVAADLFESPEGVETQTAAVAARNFALHRLYARLAGESLVVRWVVLLGSLGVAPSIIVVMVL